MKQEKERGREVPRMRVRERALYFPSRRSVKFITSPHEMERIPTIFKTFLTVSLLSVTWRKRAQGWKVSKGPT